MKNLISTRLVFLPVIFLAAGFFLPPLPSHAARASKINAEATAALNDLFARDPGARALAQDARAILVFPAITKGGFIFGGQHGNGALFQNGRITGYYKSVGASWGLQAGLQKFGYALFLMDDAAMQHLESTKGWEIGGDTNIVVVDAGAGAALGTRSAQKGIVAIFFNPKGLMAGLSLEGSKISRIYPK